nr:RNA-binding Sun protein [Streptomyces tsukubensis NRRL18488]
MVDDVLRGRGAEAPADAEWIDARPLMPDLPGLGDGPDVQLWPHRHGTDAMYLALLRRTA